MVILTGITLIAIFSDKSEQARLGLSRAISVPCILCVVLSLVAPSWLHSLRRPRVLPLQCFTVFELLVLFESTPYLIYIGTRTVVAPPRIPPVAYLSRRRTRCFVSLEHGGSEGGRGVSSAPRLNSCTLCPSLRVLLCREA